MSNTNTFRPLPASVAALFDLEFRGSEAPDSWYRYIKRNGQTDFLAVSILKDIVWWHRPEEVRTSSGLIAGYKTKFRGDKLQRDKGDYAIKFDCTKKKIDGALKVLRDLGVIVTEVAKKAIINGKAWGNVMYITIVPEKLKEITIYDQDRPNSTSMPKALLEEEIAETVAINQSGHSYTPSGVYITNNHKSDYCTGGADSLEGIPPAEEKQVPDLVDQELERMIEEKQSAVSKLKTFFQWNKTLEAMVSLAPAEQVKQATKAVEHKAKSERVGAGFFVKVMQRLANTITNPDPIQTNCPDAPQPDPELQKQWEATPEQRDIFIHLPVGHPIEVTLPDGRTMKCPYKGPVFNEKGGIKATAKIDGEEQFIPVSSVKVLDKVEAGIELDHATVDSLKPLFVPLTPDNIDAVINEYPVCGVKDGRYFLLRCVGRRDFEGGIVWPELRRGCFQFIVPMDRVVAISDKRYIPKE